MTIVYGTPVQIEAESARVVAQQTEDFADRMRAELARAGTLAEGRWSEPLSPLRS